MTMKMAQKYQATIRSSPSTPTQKKRKSQKQRPHSTIQEKKAPLALLLLTITAIVSVSSSTTSNNHHHQFGVMAFSSLHLTQSAISFLSRRLFLSKPPPRISLYYHQRLSAFSSTTSTSLNSSSDDTAGDNNMEEDNSKWERMFYENVPKQIGENTQSNPKFNMVQEGNTINNNNNSNNNNNNNIMDEINKSEIRVVTFDLDNTIWKTSQVISAANDALAEYMESSSGIDNPPRVEVMMGQLFKEDKARYCPVVAEDCRNNEDENDEDGFKERVEKMVKGPVLLSQLRKDAVKQVLRDHKYGDKSNNDKDGEDDVVDEEALTQFAEEAFQVWTNARHDAIPSNMAQSVITCLDEIQSLQTSDGHNVIVGAITDGNSDPRKVDILEKYFDFCINAEGVGVSKPDKRIYSEAIKLIISKPEVNHIFGDLDVVNSDDSILDAAYDRIGPWWVHIGDDFIKDIVAAKDLKMKSIWCTELIKGTLKKEQKDTSSEATKDGNDASNNSSSITTTKSKSDDLIKEIAKNKVVKMSIGSDDFLLDSIQAEFADATVEEFKDLSRVLFRWHQDGNNDSTTEEVASVGTFEEEIKDEILPPVVEERSKTETPTQQIKSEKFCVFCGTKLPMDAKFCSACGEKQPDLSMTS